MGRPEGEGKVELGRRTFVIVVFDEEGGKRIEKSVSLSYALRKGREHARLLGLPRKPRPLVLADSQTQKTSSFFSFSFRRAKLVPSAHPARLLIASWPSPEPRKRYAPAKVKELWR